MPLEARYISPISPYISLHLPISPLTLGLHMPLEARYISPTSPYISLHLPISPLTLGLHMPLKARLGSNPIDSPYRKTNPNRRLWRHAEMRIE